MVCITKVTTGLASCRKHCEYAHAYTGLMKRQSRVQKSHGNVAIYSKWGERGWKQGCRATVRWFGQVRWAVYHFTMAELSSYLHIGAREAVSWLPRLQRNSSHGASRSVGPSSRLSVSGVASSFSLYKHCLPQGREKLHHWVQMCEILVIWLGGMR